MCPHALIRGRKPRCNARLEFASLDENLAVRLSGVLFPSCINNDATSEPGMAEVEMDNRPIYVR